MLGVGTGLSCTDQGAGRGACWISRDALCPISAWFPQLPCQFEALAILLALPPEILVMLVEL